MGTGSLNHWTTREVPFQLFYIPKFCSPSKKVTADGDRSHEIKRCLLLGRKVMTHLDIIFKSRDITLLTNIRLVKAMVFPVVMYGCELDCEEGGAPKN